MKLFNHIILAALILLSSCSKEYLSRDPLGNLTNESFYTSPDAGFKSVINCYAGFNNPWNYQCAVAELGNMATDESEKGGSDAGDRAFVADLGYGRAISSNETLANFWSACYGAIGKCNEALENLPTAKLIDAGGNPVADNIRARYIAEVKTLRAFFYFELYKHFGGLPLIQKVMSTSDRATISRASDEDTYNFIITELTAAASDVNLPSQTQLAAADKGRITQEAVWAILAKAYLFNARIDNSLYQKAADAAKKVIDSHAFELASEYQNLFLENGYAQKEDVFAVLFGAAPNFGYGSLVPLYCNPRDIGGYGFDCPTQELVDAFEPGDPRLLFTVVKAGDKFPKTDGGQDVLTLSNGTNTGYFGRKVFLTQARRSANWGGMGNNMDLHIIRYADVLLIYAEALLGSGSGNNQAVADNINLVRTRASKSSRTDVEASSRVVSIANTPLKMVTASDDLLAAVKHERRVEFAMEYNRLYDLLRWGTYVSAMHDFSTKPYANGRGAAFKQPAGNKFLFPIPQTEIDLSGGAIKQNDGY